MVPAQPERSRSRLLDSVKLHSGLSRPGLPFLARVPPFEFRMTFCTRTLASLIACAGLFAAQGAQAEANAAEISAAKQAFESALAAEAEQRWADAALKLREAVAVKDTPGLRFHLAHCETELGRLVEASLEYDRALDLMRQGAKAKDVQKLLAPARSALLLRIPRLTLEIPADLQAPLIAIDNRRYPPSEAALGLPLNPGLHVLRVQATGRRAFERALNLKEGDQIALTVTLALSPSPGDAERVSQPPPPPRKAGAGSVPPAPESSVSSAKLYLMIGESVLTAAGLGVGIGYAVVRSAASDRVASAQAIVDDATAGGAASCDKPDSDLLGVCSDLSAAAVDHDRAAMLSQVGFVTAGVGAVALVTTWLVYPSPQARASGFSAQAVVGVGRLGVIGRF